MQNRALVFASHRVSEGATARNGQQWKRDQERKSSFCLFVYCAAKNWNESPHRSDRKKKSKKKKKNSLRHFIVVLLLSAYQLAAHYTIPNQRAKGTAISGECVAKTSDTARLLLLFDFLALPITISPGPIHIFLYRYTHTHTVKTRQSISIHMSAQIPKYDQQR